MAKNRSTVRDIINVMSSNFITLLSSIVTGLIVPKVLGATNYGYYRIFVLYTTYACLLHFGFVDGILLKDGGINYSQLNKREYRSNSIVFIIMQVIIAMTFFVVSLFITNKIYSLIFICVGICAFLMNVTTYYRYVSQAVMRFKQLSVRNTIQAILVIIFTLVMCVLYKVGVLINLKYYTYILLMVFVYLIMFLIYFISYRDITFGSHDSYAIGVKRVIYYCRIGIFLTIAYQVSNLILIIDNQFVASLFKANVYGKYSFSYSMAGAALTVLSAVSTVLLPHLKQNTHKYILSIYHKMISSMMLVVYLSLLAYFPLCILVKVLLPEYIQSLAYLKIFLPELGITCSVTMITFNYYNALGKSKFYFFMCMMVLILSTIIDFFMYLIFHNPISIAMGSFVSIFIWYITSEYFLVKWYHVKWLRNFIYMTLMITAFFISSAINNVFGGFIVYLIIYMIISLFMFKGIIKKASISLLNKI